MKILVTDSLAPEGLAVFHNAEGFEVDVKIGLKPDELKKICGAYDGWVIRSGTKITADLIEAATNLKVIGRAGVGYENIDADKLIALPLAAFERSDGLGNMARHRHHQRNGMLAGGDVVAAGGVHDDDAALGGGVGIDIFIAHAGATDHL